jgi:hypothetical protein
VNTNSALETVTARDYFFVPAPLSAEQRAYLRSWMISYDGPGRHAGISQYERFCGVAVSVSVHPSFPAVPECNDRFGWHTSDRKTAIKMSRAMRPTPKHSSYLYYSEAIKLMVAAAIETTNFLARYFDAETGTLKIEKEGYYTAARAMSAAVGFTYDGFSAEQDRCAGMSECEISLMIWADARARASAIVYHESREMWRLAKCAQLMANEIANTLRRWAYEGWLAQPAAVSLSDALAACVRQ